MLSSTFLKLRWRNAKRFERSHFGSLHCNGCKRGRSLQNDLTRSSGLSWNRIPLLSRSFSVKMGDFMSTMALQIDLRNLYCRNNMLFFDKYRVLGDRFLCSTHYFSILQKRCLSANSRNKNGLSTRSELQSSIDENPSSPHFFDKLSTFSDVPGTERGGGRRLAIVYTCKVCETRSAKRFSEQAYRHGVVLVRCPGCGNLHLIADRLGMFDDEEGGWDIEKIMEKMGNRVQAVNNDNILELTLADIAGNERDGGRNHLKSEEKDQGESSKK
mmetsp:Transcript_13702/g.30261  ORF Transcript_13702/g.30261 Transcript_13702/m.30261 type:complete len:271 (-) Transcript_13702:12-824(-)